MYITCTLAVYLPRSLCTVMIIHKESRTGKKSKSLDFKLAHSGVVGRERMGTAFPHKKLSGNGVPTREILRDIY